jgi:hypothetical protein
LYLKKQKIMLEYSAESLVNKYLSLGLSIFQAVKAAIIDIDNSKALEKNLPTLNDPLSIEVFNQLFLIKKELEKTLSNLNP